MISDKLTKIRPTQTVDDAKPVIDTLQYVCKTRNFYSEGHSKYRDAVTRLKNEFDTYFKNHNELCITVKKDRLLRGDLVIYEGTAKDGDIAFALFRDGMIKLTFLQGIDHSETQTFTKILHKYEVIPAEAEGDIVTALWEAQLSHVKYDAVDNIIDADSEGDGTTEKGIAKGQGGGGRQQSGSSLFESLETLKKGSAQQSILKKPEKLHLIDTSLIELNPSEVKILQEMVRKEEQRNATGEILDMMADILKGQEGFEFFDVVLDYLQEGLQKALLSKNFNSSLRILKRIHQARLLASKSSSSSHPGIKKFFSTVSSTEFLAVLQGPWPSLNNSEIIKAKQTLTLLPSAAITALGPMLSGDLAPVVGELIADVIVTLAERDMRPLEQLLHSQNNNLLYRLIPLLARIKRKECEKIIPKLIDHPEERVRLETLKVIIQTGLWIPEKIIPHVDDADSHIREKCLDYIASRRCKKTEKIFVDHLKKRNFRNKEHEHQVVCYRALGKCGTDELLPYLTDSLMNGGLISRFFGSARREGAAIALMELRSEDAKKVLLKASQSRFPGIKKVAQAVL